MGLEVVRAVIVITPLICNYIMNRCFRSFYFFLAFLLVIFVYYFNNIVCL